jgi:hypothetical protein
MPVYLSVVLLSHEPKTGNQGAHYDQARNMQGRGSRCRSGVCACCGTGIIGMASIPLTCLLELCLESRLVIRAASCHTYSSGCHESHVIRRSLFTLKRQRLYKVGWCRIVCPVWPQTLSCFLNITTSLVWIFNAVGLFSITFLPCCSRQCMKDWLLHCKMDCNWLRP